ncbi:MAG: two pore domain potassium channel family protein [Catenulispora sp.]|nr:two pore domain potassium channel family protein [Catenulispora sp.]
MHGDDGLDGSEERGVRSHGSSADSRRDRVVRAVLGLLVPVLLVIAYFWFPLHAFGPGHSMRRWVALVCVLGLVTAATATQIRAAIAAPLERALTGLPAVLTLAILVFAGIDVGIAKSGGQFTGITSKLDGIYFAMTTLTTVGYGDIHADGPQARAFVTVQMLYNVVVVSSAIAVGTARIQRRAERAKGAAA